jgi:hypothetical protein
MVLLKNKLWIFKIVLSIFIVFFIYNFAYAKKESITLIEGGGSSGSGVWKALTTFKSIIERENDYIQIHLTETGASVETTELMAKDKLDVNPVLYVNVPAAAYNGLLEYSGKAENYTSIRILWAGTIAPQTIFVTQKSGVKSIYDLEGKNWGAMAGSGAKRTNELIFEVLDINPNWKIADLSSLKRMIATGGIIGYFKGGCPDSSILEIASTHPITILPINKEEIQKVAKKYPGQVTHAVIRAGTYPGQERDISAAALPFGGIVSKNVPVDVVYDMISALYKHRKEYESSWSPLKGMVGFVESTAKEANVPLHPGTIKFLREHGQTIPERLIPPEMK